MNKETQLAVLLEGIANSLRKGWMDFDAVMGNLLLQLTTEGYLKKVEEHYVRSNRDKKESV